MTQIRNEVVENGDILIAETEAVLKVYCCKDGRYVVEGHDRGGLFFSENITNRIARQRWSSVFRIDLDEEGE